MLCLRQALWKSHKVNVVERVKILKIQLRKHHLGSEVLGSSDLLWFSPEALFPTLQFNN